MKDVGGRKGSEWGIYLEHGGASGEHELVSPEHPPVRTDEGHVQQVLVVPDLAEGGRHVGLKVVPPEAVLLLAMDKLVCRCPHYVISSVRKKSSLN